MVIKNIVLFQFGGIKVHVASGKIGKALLLQAGHNFDKLPDASCCRFHHLRAANIQLPAVLEESIGVVLRNLHDGLMLPLGALQHFILAGVRVGGQVAHIGDVHDPFYIVPNITQILIQHILHNIGAQIANVGEMIHCGAAGIHLYDVGVVGYKQLLLMAERIIQIHIESTFLPKNEAFYRKTAHLLVLKRRAVLAVPL